MSQLTLCSLPIEILDYIVDKLAYHQFVNLSRCNKFWYNLILNSSSFWQHRLIIDFETDNLKCATPTSYINYYKDKLTTFRKLLRRLPDVGQDGVRETLWNSLFRTLGTSIQCGIPYATDNIINFIQRIINSPIIHNQNGQGLHERKRLIQRLVKFDKLWVMSQLQNKFYEKLIDQCVCNSWFKLLESLTNKVRSQYRSLVGIYILDHLYLGRWAAKPHISLTIFKLGLNLINSKIDDIEFAIEHRWIKMIARLVFVYGLHKVSVNGEVEDMVVHEFLLMISKLDNVVANAIYRNILLFCNSYPQVLEKLLDHPLMPEMNLDAIIVFKAVFPSNNGLKYKEVITKYLEKYPNCLSKRNYNAIMNYETYL